MEIIQRKIKVKPYREGRNVKAKTAKGFNICGATHRSLFHKTKNRCLRRFPGKAVSNLPTKTR